VTLLVNGVETEWHGPATCKKIPGPSLDDATYENSFGALLSRLQPKIIKQEAFLRTCAMDLH